MNEKKVQTEQEVPLLELRTGVYDLLRRTFWTEPSTYYLEMVSTPGFVENLPFGDETKAIRQGIDLVSAYLTQSKATSSTDLLDELHWDYTRMFIGPQQLSAPPWESAYRSEDRLLFQECILHVRSSYAKYSFTAKDSWQRADDHLGLELDFMYQLSLLSGKRLHDRHQFFTIIQDSQSFLEKHLLQWAPALSRDIAASAHTDFYKGMASILTGYLIVDRDVLQELSALAIHSI